jgi:NADPH:quinone reductase
LKELGADVAIDYKIQDVTEVALNDSGGEGVDAVLDTVGGGTIVESIPATKPSGRLATILGAQGDLTALYQKNQILYGVFLTRERARLEEMGTLIERGQVRPLVAEVLPLEGVGKAHERLDSGHGRGKVVLRVTEE